MRSQASAHDVRTGIGAIPGHWLRKKIAVTILVVIIVICAAGAVLFSPLLLTTLPNAQVDWARMRDISQTYGATSVILSTLAIIGVVASLFFQAKQIRASRVEALRRLHLDLMRIALDDPATYMPCMGVTDGFLSAQRRLFTLMSLQYGRMGYEAGTIRESSLRSDLLQTVFRGEIGRAFWKDVRPHWALISGEDRRMRRFVRIANEEYEKAVSDDPPIVDRSTSHEAVAGATVRASWHPPGVLVGIGLGIVLGLARRRGH